MQIRQEKLKELLPLIIVGVLFVISVISLLFVLNMDSGNAQDDEQASGDLIPTAGDQPDPIFPACNGISVSTTQVTDEQEDIEITVNGSYGSSGTPSLITLYAAAGGQVNKSPGNGACNSVDPNDPEYSYYCKDEDVWFIVDEVADAKSLELITSYDELREIVVFGNEDSEVPFTGDIDDLGIQLAVNVVGESSGEICTSNIAYNNGDGAMFNGGAWDVPCTGGCHPLIKLVGGNPSQSLKCEEFTISTESVSSGTEEVTITIRGADGTSNPGGISLYAAAAGQVNENPEDFICEADDEDDPQYSYYCPGPEVWFLVEEETGSGSVTFRTTFNELKELIDSGIEDGGREYEGELDQLGIRLTVNIEGDSSSEFCSGNIAYNNGRGVYYNSGKFDIACENSCNKVLRLASSALSCGGSCTESAQCASGLSCVSGSCRNASCPNETDCTCASALTCGQGCTTNDQCASGLICASGQCRNASCTADTDCVCSAPPPSQTVARCQQSCSASLPCAAGLTCTGGKCINSACSTDTDCVCGNVPVSQLPDTAEGDEMILFLLIAFALFGVSGIVVAPMMLPESIKVRRPRKFRRDF